MIDCSSILKLIKYKAQVGILAEAQVGGGPGARPPLAPERGGRPPLQNEKKERMAKISITGIRKPIELLQKLYL